MKTIDIAIGLGWGGTFVSLIPLFFALFNWKSSFRSPYFLLVIYLTFCSILDISSAYIYYHYPNGTFYITPFLAFNDIIFLMGYFILLRTPHINYYKILLALLLLMNTVQFFLLKRFKDFDYLASVNNIIFVICCLLAFRYFFGQSNKKLHKTPDFLFIFAIFLCELPQIIIGIIGFLWNNYSGEYPYGPLIFSNLFYILSRIVFTVGFFYLNVLYKRRRNELPATK